VISHPESRVTVLVVPTDENIMIARHALQLVGARQ
jgi:acetate kinase